MGEATMRSLGIVISALLVAVTAAPAWAQDAAAMRREIEQLRQQLQGLTERLQRLETQPAPQMAAPPPAQPGPLAQSPANPQTQMSPPSATELLRPRQPFGLYQQRGSGQLLFDMGIAGDFVGSFTQHNVQKANGGTFTGRENRFFPREVELSLFGQIDPFARGEMRIESGEEAPGGEMNVTLAEAFITLLTLPYGTQAKLGQMRNRFGWSNVIHEHDLPWIDRPDVYRVFLGEEGLKEKGVEGTWVPDFLPFYVQVLGGDVDGDGSPDLFQKQTRNSFGWYGWGELQPWRRWAFGVRYDSTQFPAAPGYQWAVEPYVTFYPSEFLRFRMAYKHTDRSHPFDVAGNGGSARLVDELLFQATFILGAHPAHAF